ncbi:hypothetical protein LOZ12_001867 [Ophidiomyces ophidiicola]|uniref:Uncharacterized protein n=1 Tax=Ophidiomyces ophidiicola TaxID=1387563 RepID=A0ACB8V243_9EURO|nr:hypothetical protein LOZ62_002725 [Ophidiomyces ophidiicola]KAI1969383.1 hypothetical protein LOZ56_004476 [Ophidiomyces ophidiicola]KAI2010871.1 hypothetical protein LOZ50_000968 [Ophidiomyces ophidiicola]KAI2033655.1 hypothetical protein LOZ48_001989 [Ophidiomyces ophidiicola]KAI2041187.1 hypothetical protein LOZ47_000730 [Ophidiomyces ophidiicola]
MISLAFLRSTNVLWRHFRVHVLRGSVGVEYLTQKDPQEDRQSAPEGARGSNNAVSVSTTFTRGPNTTQRSPSRAKTFKRKREPKYVQENIKDTWQHSAFGGGPSSRSSPDINASAPLIQLTALGVAMDTRKLVEADVLIRKVIGQLVIIGFEGVTVPEEVKKLIQPPYYCGSIVLFNRNIVDASQLTDLINTLQRIARHAGHEYPLIIAFEQENDVLASINPSIAVQLPGATALAATGSSSTEYAFDVGYATGETLRALGFNMIYAPSCDVSSPAADPAIRIRSAGDNWLTVGQLANATANGLRKASIIPCIKHFPGHGSIKTSCHASCPQVNKKHGRLEICDLVPFRRLTSQKIEAVMVSHAVFPSFGHLPASINKRVINILRDVMEHDGLVITDCLEKFAISSCFLPHIAARAAIFAGVDCVMLSSSFDMQVRTLEQIHIDYRFLYPQIHRSAIRIRRLKCARYPRSWLTTHTPNSPSSFSLLHTDHSKLARAIYNHSVTLVRDYIRALPLNPINSVIYVYPYKGSNRATGADNDYDVCTQQSRVSAPLTEFSCAIKLHAPHLIELPFFDESIINDENKRIIGCFDAVILASRNAQLAPYQLAVGKWLESFVEKLISVATCLPHDFISSAINTCIAIYQPTREAYEAAAEIIFGQRPPLGKLPFRVFPKRVEIRLLNVETDSWLVAHLWRTCFGSDPLGLDQITDILKEKKAVSFVAYINGLKIGFLTTYQSYIAVLAVCPSYRSRGAGTALILEARRYIRTQLGIPQAHTGSHLLGFHLGMHIEPSSEIEKYFHHRGFVSFSKIGQIYSICIKTYSPPLEILQLTEAAGVRIVHWNEGMHRETILAIKELWGQNHEWVLGYETLARMGCYERVLVALDHEKTQIGWILTKDLGLESNFERNPRTSQPHAYIGCGGILPSLKRGSVVGYALVVMAILSLQRKNVSTGYIQSPHLEEFYEKAGFKIWQKFQHMTVTEI